MYQNNIHQKKEINKKKERIMEAYNINIGNGKEIIIEHEEILYRISDFNTNRESAKAGLLKLTNKEAEAFYKQLEIEKQSQKVYLVYSADQYMSKDTYQIEAVADNIDDAIKLTKQTVNDIKEQNGILEEYKVFIQEATINDEINETTIVEYSFEPNDDSTQYIYNIDYLNCNTNDKNKFDFSKVAVENTLGQDSTIMCYTLRDNFQSGTKLEKGEVVGLVRGLEGYIKTEYGVKDRDFVENLNKEKFNIDPKMEDAYTVMSVFGTWDNEENIVKSFLEIPSSTKKQR